MSAQYKSGELDLTVSIEKRDREQFEVRVGARRFALAARLVDPATLRIDAPDGAHTALVAREGERVQVFLRGAVYHFDTAAPDDSAAAHAIQTPRVTSPMPGKVLRVLVHEGQHVERGDGLIILEAMKMENRIIADGAAVIARVAVAEGQTVDAGALLLELEPSS